MSLDLGTGRPRWHPGSDSYRATRRSKTLKLASGVTECGALLYSNAPARTRTWDPRLRRPMLYPPELRARNERGLPAALGAALDVVRVPRLCETLSSA